MTEQVYFTEEETKQLAEAHAIRQRVRAARRKRQDQADQLAATIEERRKQGERDKKALAVKAKADFDDRVRRVLLELTYKMKDNRVHLVTNPLSTYSAYDSTRKVKVFTMADSQGDQLDADIYWVYGKGFEWA